jgi:hypothetical protein
MVLFERLNFKDEFSRLGLEGLSALQRKLLIDLIRQEHPQLWSRFKSNAYSWSTAKEQLNQFINLHYLEFIEELRRAGFNHDGFSKTVDRKGGAYV